MDTRSASSGYLPLSTIALDNGTATPFSGVAAGKVHLLKVLTGTMRVNFEGDTTSPVYFPISSSDGTQELTLSHDLLQKARVDTASAFTAVLLFHEAPLMLTSLGRPVGGGAGTGGGNLSDAGVLSASKTSFVTGRDLAYNLYGQGDTIAFGTQTAECSQTQWTFQHDAGKIRVRFSNTQSGNPANEDALVKPGPNPITVRFSLTVPSPTSTRPNGWYNDDGESYFVPTDHRAIPIRGTFGGPRAS